MATPATLPTGSILDEKLKKSSPGKMGGILFAVILLAGFGYIISRIYSDLLPVHTGLRVSIPSARPGFADRARL